MSAVPPVDRNLPLFFTICLKMAQR